MNLQRKFAFLISAAVHGVALIGLTGGLTTYSFSLLSVSQRREEFVRVEIIDLSDLRDQVFDFDVRRIASRGGRLFPFTGQMLLSPSPTSIQGVGQRADAGSFVIESRLAQRSQSLTLSSLQIQALLDASWSRRQRWASFQQILDLVQRFDPQDGDLPLLLRRYVNENLLQPIHASGKSEPKLWALLSIAADHSDFLQLITNFILEVPSSKSTTELLFLLDKLVQANLNAVLELFRLDTPTGLEWTKTVNPSAAETLAALRTYHERALGRSGLWNESALEHTYNEVRIRVLRQLSRCTPQGYRVNDARYLIGEIYWQQGRVVEAQKAWTEITSDVNDEYFVVYSEVLSAIRSDKLSHEQIDLALDAQERRWLHASFLRLRHFGFRFDTF